MLANNFDGARPSGMRGDMVGLIEFMRDNEAPAGLLADALAADKLKPTKLQGTNALSVIN
jgi:hypothetical protein